MRVTNVTYVCEMSLVTSASDGQVHCLLIHYDQILDRIKTFNAFDQLIKVLLKHDIS